MFVKQVDLVPVEWPIADWQIRAAYPNTSLPEYISDELSFELGYGPFVFNGYPTSYEPKWENIQEIPPILIDGKYQQSYEITEKYTPEEKQAIMDAEARNGNKAYATSLLQQTDWTATVDINNPAYSNPYLDNQDAFLAYRSQVRQIAINPPIVVDPWPTMPTEVWVTV